MKFWQFWQKNFLYMIYLRKMGNDPLLFSKRTRLSFSLFQLQFPIDYSWSFHFETAESLVVLGIFAHLLLSLNSTLSIIQNLSNLYSLTKKIRNFPAPSLCNVHIYLEYFPVDQCSQLFFIAYVNKGHRTTGQHLALTCPVSSSEINPSQFSHKINHKDSCEAV